MKAKKFVVRATKKTKKNGWKYGRMQDEIPGIRLIE